MSVISSDVHRQQPRAAAVLMQSSSCVNFPHSTDAFVFCFFTTQTANHVVVNTIVNTVVNTAFFFSSPGAQR
jgi:hypothetical protein